jgi:hypothetical protein
MQPLGMIFNEDETKDLCTVRYTVQHQTKAFYSVAVLVKTRVHKNNNFY